MRRRVLLDVTHDDDLLPLPDPGHWRDHAACAGTPVTVFYPPGSDMPHGRNAPQVDGYARARAICDACPVRDQCITEAMHEEGRAGRQGRYGFRGGHTPDERFELPWRTCQRCRTVFPIPTHRGGSVRVYCSPACRAEGIAEQKAAHRAKVVAERRAVVAGLTPVCDVCGEEFRNNHGMKVHRRQLHGIGAVA